MGDLRELVQHTLSLAIVDGSSCQLGCFAKGRRVLGDPDGRRGIHHHDIAPRSGCATKDLSDDGGTGSRILGQQRLALGRLNSKVRRRPREILLLIPPSPASHWFLRC